MYCLFLGNNSFFTVVFAFLEPFEVLSLCTCRVLSSYSDLSVKFSTLSWVNPGLIPLTDCLEFSHNIWSPVNGANFGRFEIRSSFILSCKYT